MKRLAVVLVFLLGITDVFAQQKENVKWVFGKDSSSNFVTKVEFGLIRNIFGIPSEHGEFKLAGLDTTSVVSEYHKTLFRAEMFNMTPEIQKRVKSSDLDKSMSQPFVAVGCDSIKYSTLSMFFLVRESYAEYVSIIWRARMPSDKFSSFDFKEETTEVKAEILWGRFSICLGIVILALWFILWIYKRDPTLTIFFPICWFLFSSFGFFMIFIVVYCCDAKSQIKFDVLTWQQLIIFLPITIIYFYKVFKIWKNYRKKLEEHIEEPYEHSHQ
ncbi:MAG: hypothetical protein NT068_00235 [Candidatus Nomurabacteria bacterium]|nr:hypothetical protein [Candidatus Nomurabacteria bacterium]